jgi:hypothetical protein
MMNNDTKSAFANYFGQPNTVFVIVMVLLACILGIVLIKLTLAAWNDVRRDPDFDATDFFTTITRMLALLLVFALLFFH